MVISIITRIADEHTAEWFCEFLLSWERGFCKLALRSTGAGWVQLKIDETAKKKKSIKFYLEYP